MRCPVCRCEVGNQAVCPYCGSTVYMGNASWSANDYSRSASQYAPNARNQATREKSKISNKRLQRIETKLDLMLVMQIGSFLLLLMVLIMVALK